MAGVSSAQIRSEFIRKEESIRALQTALEEEHRFFQKELERQDKNREAVENTVALELKRLQ